LLAKPAFEYMPPFALSLWRPIFALHLLFLVALGEENIRFGWKHYFSLGPFIYVL